MTKCNNCDMDSDQ